MKAMFRRTFLKLVSAIPFLNVTDLFAKPKLVFEIVDTPIHGPVVITESVEVLKSTFEIAANPMVRLSDIKARRFYIVDDVVGQSSICRQRLSAEICSPKNQSQPHD